MLGNILVRNDTINYIYVNYTITYIDNASHGSLKYSEPVNMTWLKIYFYDLYQIFWHDINF